MNRREFVRGMVAVAGTAALKSNVVALEAFVSERMAGK
jgi:hypothetical protein